LSSTEVWWPTATGETAARVCRLRRGLALSVNNPLGYDTKNTKCSEIYEKASVFITCKALCWLVWLDPYPDRESLRIAQKKANTKSSYSPAAEKTISAAIRDRPAVENPSRCYARISMKTRSWTMQIRRQRPYGSWFMPASGVVWPRYGSVLCPTLNGLMKRRRFHLFAGR